MWKIRAGLLLLFKMWVLRGLRSKMVAEAFHSTDYESEHVADTAIFPTSLSQSPEEKVIIPIYYHCTKPIIMFWLQPWKINHCVKMKCQDRTICTSVIGNSLHHSLYCMWLCGCQIIPSVCQKRKSKTQFQLQLWFCHGLILNHTNTSSLHLHWHITSLMM